MEYRLLVEVYEALGRTSKRLEKAKIVTELLKGVPEEKLPDMVYLLQGRVFPEWDERKIGFSSRLVLKAVAKATGTSSSEVEEWWRKKGDLGLVAEALVEKKKQSTLASGTLSVEKVVENIRKLTGHEGKGTVERKVMLVTELLSLASPGEAKFLVRTVLEQLRVGIASGIVRDAIAGAFGRDVKEVESAFHVKGEYGEVARLAKLNELFKAKLVVGKPVGYMLALLVGDVEEAFSALGKPALFEYKFDGFRLQIHKQGEKIQLFTRRPDKVTEQFPDVVEAVRNGVKGESFILDAEAVGYDAKSKKYLPFQSISQRIKRKYDINEMAEKFPVEVNVFDVLYADGKNCMMMSQGERRKLVEKMVSVQEKKIRPTKALITSSVKEAKEFYEESLRRGNEGLVVKKLDASYSPGRYVGGWVKLKPVLEPLDLVIVGAEYGTGKRAGMLTSYVVACRDGKSLLTCGMVSTGLKEKEGKGVTFAELSGMLEPLVVGKSGRYVEVKPKVVVEVVYEEVQKSPTYSSGYALRFPRFKSLRMLEKQPKDANTLEDVERVYGMQKQR